MPSRKPTPSIRFESKPRAVDDWMILQLPIEASRKLPSRGQVAVEATVNGHHVRTVVEPDGDFGHWMKVDEDLVGRRTLEAGVLATVELHVLEEWPEPEVPRDLKKALASAPQKIRDIWRDITPMARWEWVRWVNSTRNPDTRRRRVEVALSKMQHGKRRPCCFNLSSCTDPDLAKNGKLAV